MQIPEEILPQGSQGETNRTGNDSREGAVWKGLQTSFGEEISLPNHVREEVAVFV